MIVGEQKPIDEIWRMIRDHGRLLVFGCNCCVAVCHQGGAKQAGILASLLNMRAVQDGVDIKIAHSGIERQCEHDFFVPAMADIEQAEAVLSLACGVGVQFMAEKFPSLPVYPGLNTTFLGAVPKPGLFAEKCQACGNCILAFTAGICPVARCAKRLFNGPCGGASDGRCEISKTVECAWQLIIDRLDALGRLDEYEQLMPLKDWSSDRAGGPRRLNIEEYLP